MRKIGFALLCGLAIYTYVGYPRQASDLVVHELARASNAVSSKMQKVGHPTFVSPHASPIRLNGQLVFVVNTPSDTVDVIDADTREITKRNQRWH